MLYIAAHVSITQHNLSKQVLKTTPNMKAELHEDIAKWFYTCNIPFNEWEHEQVTWWEKCNTFTGWMVQYLKWASECKMFAGWLQNSNNHWGHGKECWEFQASLIAKILLRQQRKSLFFYSYYMESMRTALHNDDHENLFVYGYTSHWLSLLEQDITPSAVRKHIIEVQTYSCNNHSSNAWLS